MTDMEERSIKHQLVKLNWQVFAFFAVHAVGVTWWAATLTGKVDTLVTLLAKQEIEFRREMDRIEARLTKVELELHPPTYKK